MQRKDIKVRSSTGGEFDCYLATPDGGGKAPAMVLASAVHGVDQDIRAIADEFASHGYIAAAPDLFWRTVPGPLGRDDDRTKTRSQPRLEVIRKGETDMADTLAELRKLPQFNGRAAAMGFCFGGPYAILGPKRLGYAAGVSCHGTQMMKNVEVHIFPGIQHGYMMPASVKAYDKKTRDFSMERALAILNGLRGEEPIRKAS